jgi:murein DD-endopeptidase MepM/ murein hydrolase activator NlpD
VYEARLVGEREYESRQVEVALEVERSTVAGTIESSFFGAVTSAGESEALARDVVTIFQWDIDFSRDVLPGDGFRVLFEKVSLEGEFLRYGRVLAAEYDGARAQHGAYYFDDPEHAGYYTAEGVPLERFFLAAPCRHRRISSRFDLERWHPVLERRVPHLGVDYAADTGTPVWASADGEVSHMGYDSRAGNMVKIRHANSYESIYAHLNGFAGGLREGQTVEQGELIGYVGSTGMSTGPHLHYGLKRRGDYVDPLEQEFSRGDALSGRALRDFQRRHSQLETHMAEVALPSAQGRVPEEESVDLLPDFEEMLQEAGGHDY